MASNSSKLVTKLNYTNTTKALIKQAIRNKGVEVLDSDTLRSYATKISEISTSTDQSDATVVADDMVQGKIAYNDNVRVVGTLPVYNSLTSEATNIIADDNNSIIKSNFTSDTKLVLNSSSNVQINLPYNTLASTIGLRADILKENEVVLGITGTYSTGVSDIRYLYSVGDISIAEITPQLMQSVSNGNITVSEIATYPAIAINSYYNNYIAISLVNHDTQHCSYLFKIENDSLVYIDKLHNNDTNWNTGYCWQSIITDIDTENDIVYILTARTDYDYNENTIFSKFENNSGTYTRTDSIVSLPSQGNVTFGNMIFKPYGYIICGRYLYKFNASSEMFEYMLYSNYISLLSNWDNLTGEVTAQGTTFYQYSFYGIGNDGYDYTWIQNSIVDDEYTIGDYINGVISPDRSKCIFPNGVILEVINDEITTNKLAEFDMQTLVGFVPKHIYYISDTYYIITPETGNACLVEFDDINNTFTLLYSNLTNGILNYYARNMMYNNYTIFNLDVDAVLNGFEKLTIYTPIQDTTHRVGVIIEGNPVYYTSFNRQLQSADMLFGKTAFDFNGEVLTGSMPNNGQLVYTPTTSQQIIPLGYTSGGTIAGVTSDIDADIQQDNIKVGVDILGVTGTFTSDATATANNITDGETAYVNGQKITGTLNNIDVLDDFIGVSATVNSASTNISFHQIDEVDFYWKYDSSDPNKTLVMSNNLLANAAGVTANKVKQGETILDVTGTVIELAGETKIIIPTITQQTILPSSGKNGITEITVEAVDNTIDANIISNNIKDGVTILGVTGNVIELSGEQITIIPSTSQQVITPATGKNGITQAIIEAVDNTIDTNIVAENIKEGVTILGVTGNLNVGVDINDYFENTISNGNAYRSGILNMITNIPSVIEISGTSANYLFANCVNLENIPLLNTENIINAVGMCANCMKLTNIPNFNTNLVTNMSSMFANCTNLVEISNLNTSNVTSMENIFVNCTNLSNDSLDNIMAMCINSNVDATNKTLTYVGLTQPQANICETLNNYQNFVDAGWVTGY